VPYGSRIFAPEDPVKSPTAKASKSQPKPAKKQVPVKVDLAAAKDGKVPNLKQAVEGMLSESEKTHGAEDGGDLVGGFLDFLASYTVPHAWFNQFYILSIASSIFWAFVILCHLAPFTTIARWNDRSSTTGQVVHHGKKTEIESRGGMSIEAVGLVWALMFTQGYRRLSECLAFNKPSRARMGVAHWVMGMGFYALMGIAVWIEGIREYSRYFSRSTLAGLQQL
jgi:hypothetical protein